MLLLSASEGNVFKRRSDLLVPSKILGGRFLLVPSIFRSFPSLFLPFFVYDGFPRTLSPRNAADFLADVGIFFQFHFLFALPLFSLFFCCGQFFTRIFGFKLQKPVFIEENAWNFAVDRRGAVLTDFGGYLDQPLPRWLYLNVTF